MKLINLPDIVLIAAAAYVFVWGGNLILRNAGMAGYQA